MCCFRLSLVSFLLMVCLVGCKKVTVDFSNEESAKSMSGFLGVIEESKIDDQYVLPLKPKYWRGPSGLHAVEQAERFGAKLIYVVGNGWGSPLDQGSQAPFDDYERWRAHVRAATQLYGHRVIYDLWNEPDIPFFWGFWKGATFDKFLEMAKVTHDVIREELGEEAVISGPSISFFSRKTIKRFMDFCKDNNMKVQVLSFHLLYQPDSLLPGLQNSMRELREQYIDSPEYEAVGLEEIQVNEFLMAHQQNARPGSILSFMRNMEMAEVDGAAKACWSHPDDCKNLIDCYLPFNDKWKTCGDGSINGLLTKEFKPRAAWWAYKHYADGVDSRVKATSSTAQLMVLASSESEQDNVAQVMIAYNGDFLKPIDSVDIELTHLSTLGFLDDAIKSVDVTVKKIPYIGNGSIEVLELPIESVDRLPVNNGVANLQISNINPYDVFLILINR